MAEGGSKGLFRSLLATLDLGPPPSDLVLDAVLMVALADGDFSLAEQDALEVALAEGDLGEVTWQEVLARADALEADAPFFTQTRARLFDARWADGAKEAALTTAARVATAGAPMADEQRAFLTTLAEGLGVDTPTLEGLLPPWGTRAAPAEVGLLRPPYADPEAAAPTNLFDALSRAEGRELRALMFKLSAPRDLASLALEGARITEVGTSVELGDRRLRIDAILVGETEEWWVRCVSRGEALFAAERTLWPSLLSTLAEHQRLAVVHEGRLSPADADLVERLDQDRVRVRQV